MSRPAACSKSAAATAPTCCRWRLRFPGAFRRLRPVRARDRRGDIGGASELGLANVTLLQQDFAAIPPALGRFDYIIAHGIYSWVPPAARDALFRLAAERLSDHGVMFVSYNVYPGCHVRQAAWEALHFHVDGIADLRTRLDTARSLAALLAEPGLTQRKATSCFATSSGACRSSRTARCSTTTSRSPTIRCISISSPRTPRATGCPFSPRPSC